MADLATLQPSGEKPEIGQGLRARKLRATSRGIERAEALFAAVALVGMLAIVTLTFGYAFDGLTSAHTTGFQRLP